MSIVGTLLRPVDINGSANTLGRPVDRRLDDAKANVRPKRAATTPSLAEQCNRTIEEKARSVLRSSSYHPVRWVSCEVCDCVLILRGRVPSFYMKQMAQTIVRHLLDGSQILDNQLEVDYA